MAQDAAKLKRTGFLNHPQNMRVRQRAPEQMKMLTMTTINNAEHLLCPFVLPLEITAVNLRAVK